jgi:hypothetical protein
MVCHLPPNPKIIVHADLSQRHPLEVGANGIHLPLVDRNATILQEGLFGIVHGAEAISVAVVGLLVIVPNTDPWELLVG